MIAQTDSTPRYLTAFGLTLLIYLSLLGLGIWLFSTPAPKQDIARPVPVTLSMFQLQAPRPTPPKPTLAPHAQPKPQIKPKPLAKPIQKTRPKPKKNLPKKVRPKPVVKPQPKIVPKLNPVLKPKTALKTKPRELSKTVPPAPAKPLPVAKPVSSPVTTPSVKASAEPKKIAPKANYSAQQVTDAKQQYLNELATLLGQLAQDSYPSRARRRNWQGKVLIEFTILRNGRIQQTHLIRSSSYNSLDEAALEIISDKMANHFKAFPKSIDQDHWIIQVPITYQLN